MKALKAKRVDYRRLPCDFAHWGGLFFLQEGTDGKMDTDK